jgi:uncharacterized membrane protein
VEVEVEDILQTVVQVDQVAVLVTGVLVIPVAQELLVKDLQELTDLDQLTLVAVVVVRAELLVQIAMAVRA